jgi:hypothetical protein
MLDTYAHLAESWDAEAVRELASRRRAITAGTSNVVPLQCRG